MANQLTANGLQVDTLQEIIDKLTASLQAIYGADTNFDQNSPDGQMVNIFAQAQEDALELLVACFNSFAVENAFGVVLDQRVALNGLARRAGTHTETNVTVTVSGAVNLVGLDALVNDPTAIVFTVADGNGVQFELMESISIADAGDNILAFWAKDIGGIQPTPNTITNVVTVVAEVTAVNNPDPATLVGVDEESDPDLKIRHARSFFLASTGPADAVEAAILAADDVEDAFVAENDTVGTVDTIPAHSIWAIVNGGSDADIGQAIYAKKAPGCGMKGSQTSVITRPNGTSFTAKFDRAISEDLTIKFNLGTRVPGIVFDEDAIKEALVAALVYKLNQSPSIGDIVVAMATIEPRAVLTVLGVSDDGGDNYSDMVSPTDLQHYFTLAADDINITT